MKVISIVPRLPPATDGVGDYALKLACQLRQNSNIQTYFIAGDPDSSMSSDLHSFPVSLIQRRLAADLYYLLAQQTSSTVILHYVGYGYAKRGCPTWLISGLQQWKQNTPNAALITMFHEVYAAGRPLWTSAFWFFPLQKNLASRLAHLSNSILTSKQLYATILQNLAPQHCSIPVLPIFSNVGESRNPPPLTKRHKWLVIFGGTANRSRVYQSSIAILRQVCRSLQINTIVDIGPKLNAIPSAIDNISISAMGQLPATEIRQIFLQSTAGFLDYNPDYLAKSGIFAAYCAYGLLP
ncbi:MAG TPA: hypothetical protein VIQ31_30960, partial [Phormidium sp.]